ncbi:hypothetical protein ANCCAN_10454 [Ancylostoma caninum]|uniref:SCP domain-containing protein n=1 Tax=Ancylostoma caninum TaxID=29170 RepID=A0A368GKM9_ANCCA|nr:hypothetical protein ANCCAN_10454 [Ancylostoma caninum]
MTSWFGQLKSMGLDEKETYDNNVKTSAPDFANMVYEKVTKVGCALFARGVPSGNMSVRQYRCCHRRSAVHRR